MKLVPTKNQRKRKRRNITALPAEWGSMQTPDNLPVPTIACNLDSNLLLAALPLLEAGKVQALEWSFDALYQQTEVPDWFHELLQTFSEAGRLVGHGVFFSIFSGKWLPEQAVWVDHLRALAGRYRFDHVTEHFGFMTGTDFHKGAPLGVALSRSTLAIGQDRLRRIQDAAQCPVGLENLAFAYNLPEAKRQGDFLQKLLESVDGFLILDVHNLYCQMHNFSIGFDDLLAHYPLERVREIHVSGGSWSPVAARPGTLVRRDTHDNAVPEAVFDLLAAAIDRCPNLRYVVLEQINEGLNTADLRSGFQRDFLRMEALLRMHSRVEAPPPPRDFATRPGIAPTLTPKEDLHLYEQQTALSRILETASSVDAAVQHLRNSVLAHSDWHIEQWQPEMLETAMAIAQKWA